MILQRISKALRQQDWFTVVIETLIVVFGVFIGLQVNNWNTARIEQTEQVSLLQRLEADFSVSEPTMQNASKRLSLAASQTAQLINYLRANETPPDDEDILHIVEAPTRLGSMPNVTATYEEMISTGGLSRIQNEDLRNALVKYGQNAERFQFMYESAIGVIGSSSNPNTVFSATRSSTDWSLLDDQSMIISFDWQKLQAADAQIYAIFIHQNILSQIADRQLAEVQNILAVLKAETR